MDDYRIYIATRCTGGTFNTTMCPPPSVIRVVEAYYGASSCVDEQCCPSSTDICRLEAGSHIKEECDGNSDCGNLTAPRLDDICKTDYLEIQYQCIPEGKLLKFLKRHI